MGLLGAIWLARTQSTSDSIWNQLFVGISESCAEANVQLSLSDLFFEHQRGTFLGVYVLATSVGTYLGPLIAGFVADSNLGWRWIGWMAVVISGATIVVLYFTLEETLFDRPAYQVGERFTSRQNPAEPESGLQGLQEKKAGLSDAVTTPVEVTDEKPKSYWQRIALITPAANLEGFGFQQYCVRLIHTMRVFSFPAVIYSGIQWGAQDAWLMFYLTVEDDYWSDAPWYYGDVGVGLMNLPCLIGAVLGCIYGGYFSDMFMIWMAKRNGGVREAEHRLWFLFPLAIISPLGMLLFGIGTGKSWPWPGPYIGL
ncbi:hypothetical protein F66182_13095, partial [Fusarium sp. NRRL 66182]